jgi:translation elongation factor EF-Tu-like GTPase
VSLIVNWSFTAKVALLSSESGGRSTPLPSGYRGDMVLGVPGMMNGGLFEVEEPIEPGSSGRVKVKLIAPLLNAGRLYPGQQFRLCEGYRCLGSGTILEVLDESLMASSAP